MGYTFLGVDAELVIKIITMIIQLLAISLAAVGAYYAATINRKNKIADVVLHCMARYDQISEKRQSLELLYKPENPTEFARQSYLHHRRYWGLKSDQFDYWLSGLIDCETICSWFFSVLQHFKKNEKDPDLFMANWAKIREDHLPHNASFVTLVDGIFELGERKLTNRFDNLLGVARLLSEMEFREAHFIRFSDIYFFGLIRLRGPRMAKYIKRVIEEDRHTHDKGDPKIPAGLAAILKANPLYSGDQPPDVSEIKLTGDLTTTLVEAEGQGEVGQPAAAGFTR